MATSTPKKCAVRVVVSTGTSASGTVKTKSINLFPTTALKTSLSSSGFTAAMNVADLLEPMLAKTRLRVEYAPVSELSSGE